MIRSKVDFTKQEIVRMKEDLGIFLVFVTYFHEVTIVNTDVEKSFFIEVISKRSRVPNIKFIPLLSLY